jgi:hypothetical protein
MTARRGQWVQIHSILLKVGERAPSVPSDTASVPLELRVRGFLQDEAASIGQIARVRTAAGRIVEGTLEIIEPRHVHDFGNYIPELSQAGDELTVWLAGGDENEYEL